MNTLVLVNRNADLGRGARTWQRVAPHLRNLLGCAPAVCDDRDDWAERVRDVARSGPATVIAVGGDGTVHRVANLLLGLDRDAGVRLGAIGIGSGNAFHQPTNGCLQVRGVPVRCSTAGAVRQNVIRVDYEDTHGRMHRGYAVTSCSLGMVALGNRLFSRGRGPVGACRRLGALAGVWCAAAVSTATQPGMRVRAHVDGQPAFDGGASLIGVYINPHFASGLRYTGPMDAERTCMGVTVLPNVSVFERWRLLHQAARTELPGPPRTQHWDAQHCAVELDGAQWLEMDGEVVSARTVHMQLLRGALEVCR